MDGVLAAPGEMAAVAGRDALSAAKSRMLRGMATAAACISSSPAQQTACVSRACLVCRGCTATLCSSASAERLCPAMGACGRGPLNHMGVHTGWLQGENAWVFVHEDDISDAVKHYFSFASEWGGRGGHC